MFSTAIRWSQSLSPVTDEHTFTVRGTKIVVVHSTDDRASDYINKAICWVVAHDPAAFSVKSLRVYPRGSGSGIRYCLTPKGDLKT